MVAGVSPPLAPLLFTNAGGGVGAVGVLGEVVGAQGGGPSSSPPFLTITGSGFRGGLGATCRFTVYAASNPNATTSTEEVDEEEEGGISPAPFYTAFVPALFVSESEVRCGVPYIPTAAASAHPPLATPISATAFYPTLLEVSNDGGGGEWSAGGTYLELRAGLQLTSAYPMSGPVAGGTLVSIGSTGGFLEYDTAAKGGGWNVTLGCAFGPTLVPIHRVVSDTLLECVAPPESELGGGGGGGVGGAMGTITHALSLVLLLTTTTTTTTAAANTATPSTTLAFPSMSQFPVSKDTSAPLAFSYFSLSSPSTLSTLAVTPAAGGAEGGTLVLLSTPPDSTLPYFPSPSTTNTAAAATNTPLCGCKFGSLPPVPCTSLTPTHLTCVSPNAASLFSTPNTTTTTTTTITDAAGSASLLLLLLPITIPLEVTFNGGLDWSLMGASFSYYPPIPPLLTVYPPLAPTAGGTTVTITTAGGSLGGSGVGVGATSALTTPPCAWWGVSGRSISSASSPPSLITTTPSTYASQTSITCTTPPLGSWWGSDASSGGGSNGAQEQGGVVYGGVSLGIPPPTSPFSSLSPRLLLPFTFIPPHGVTSLSPSQALWSGGTPVFVSGWGFINTSLTSFSSSTPLPPQTLCGWGMGSSGSGGFVGGSAPSLTVTPATYLSPTTLTCSTPSRTGVGGVSGVHSLPLRVSFNGGGDWGYGQGSTSGGSGGGGGGGGGASITLLPSCPPGSWCPSGGWNGGEILPCPPGSSCPGWGNANHTPCAPGSFQPRGGAAACLPCPVGFICGGGGGGGVSGGSVRPTICPPGFVCGDRGLAAPGEVCPPGHWCPPGTKTPDPLDFTGLRRLDIGYAPLGGGGGGSGGSGGSGGPGIYSPASPGPTSAAGAPYADPSAVLDEWDARGMAATASSPTPGLPYNASARSWAVLPRMWPASGSFQLERPPIGFTTTTLTPPLILYGERPRPCPVGTFCRAGAASPSPLYANFSTPTPCYPGFFCPPGSPTPHGSGPCPPGFYCPTPTEAYICPPGAHCPGTGNVKPRPCYPGTYNPLRQQGNCTLCPPGHVCPRWGGLEPELCPAGFVCSEFGLPAPALQCPPGYYCPPGTATDDVAGSLVDDPNAPPFRIHESWAIPDTLRSYPYNIVPPPYRGLFPGGEGGSRGGTDGAYPGGVQPPNSRQRRTTTTTQNSVEEFERDRQNHLLLRHRRRALHTILPGPFSPFSPPNTTQPTSDWSSPGALATHRFDGDTESSAGGYYLWPTSPVTSWRDWNRGLYAPPESTGDVPAGGGPPSPTIPREAWLNTSADPALYSLRRLVLDLLVSGPLSPTYTYMASAAPLLPLPCAPGTFCMGGVASPSVVDAIPALDGALSHPQTCPPGQYCRYGAPSANGTGPCFSGHYCPAGSLYPIKSPPGSIVGSAGAVVPQLCLPGSFSPLPGGFTCYPCPAGHSCASYGTYIPSLCPPGRYRSGADSLTCMPCPGGTYGPSPGASDVGFCLACPPGSVCPKPGMVSLNASVPCPEGYACGEGVGPAHIFDQPCPGGYVCDVGTPAVDAWGAAWGPGPGSNVSTPAGDGGVNVGPLAVACSPGFYCPAGTAASGAFRNGCPVGQFCPRGTPSAYSPETACPRGTASISGSYSLLQCLVSPTSICLKDPATTYLTSLTYAGPLDSTGTPISVTAGVGGVVEVGVLARVNPMNASAAPSPWRNDTLVVGGVSPSNGTLYAPGDIFLVYGANFGPGVRTFCRWVFNISVASVSSGAPGGSPAAASAGPLTLYTEAISCLPSGPGGAGCPRGPGSPPLVPCLAGVGGLCSGGALSPNRLACPQPDLTTIALPIYKFGFYAANLSVGEAGGWYTTPPLTVGFRAVGLAGDPPSVTLAQGQAYSFSVAASPASAATYDAPPGASDLSIWYELPTLSYAQLSIDFAPIPPAALYGQHWRLAIYAQNSTCDNSWCYPDGTVASRDTWGGSPCHSPIPLPLWFTSALAQGREGEAHQLLNFTLWAMEDVKFHVEVEILWGPWLSLAPLFANAATLNIWAPARAKDVRGLPSPPMRPLENGLTSQGRTTPTAYYFGALFTYGQLASIAVPLNMPPRYLTTAAGRVIVGFNVSAANPGVSLQLDPFAAVHVGPEYWQPPSGVLATNTLLYREIFQSITPNPLTNPSAPAYTYGFDTLLFPYVPFVSNCYAYDSYLYWHVLFEDAANCGLDPYTVSHQTSARKGYPPLPPIDAITPALPWDGLNILVGHNYPNDAPIADSCNLGGEAGLPCNYEEALATPDAQPRWFEVTTGNSLFIMLRDAMSDVDWQAQKATVNAQLLAPSQLDGSPSLSDNQIPVLVTHEANLAGACIINCYPRTVNLAITYYQIDTVHKRITSAAITFGPQFDRNPNNTNYTFTLDWYASNYSDLVQGTQFGPPFFSFIYVIIGVAFATVGFVAWLFWRTIFLFLRGSAPPFSMSAWLAVVTPGFLTGYALGSIPLLLSTLAVFGLLKGWYLVYNPIWGSYPTNFWALDSIIASYLHVTVDATQLAHTRTMRVGASFLIQALIYMWVGASLMMPNLVSKRERRLARGSDARVAARDIWTPTTWRKLHYMYITVCYAMVLVFLVDISFMTGFQGAVYYHLVAWKFAAILFGEYLEATLGDLSLVAPLDCNMAIIQGIVTFGAPDLTTFIVSYAIDLAFGYAELIFTEPYMDVVIDFVTTRIERVNKRVREYRERNRKKTLQEELYEEEIEAERKKKALEALELKALRLAAERDSLPVAARAALAREERRVGGGKKQQSGAAGAAVAGGGDADAEAAALAAAASAPPPTKRFPKDTTGALSLIVNAMVGYSLDIVSVLQSCYMIVLFMYFRDEIGIPISYGLREQDMRLYFYFSLIIIPFQLMWDMFKLSTLETVHSLKVFEYLVYARYRFLSRTQRWVGMQDNVDEVLEGPFRKADQMCFSSQYNFAMYVYTSGMFFFLMANIVLGVAGGNNSGNFLQDPAFPLLVLYNCAASALVFWACWKAANAVGLWQVQGGGNMWRSSMGEGTDAMYALPGVGEVSGDRLTKAETAFVNARISSETFRFKFLDLNRLWLVRHLPDLLTPRTLRRSRPYLLGVLGRILAAQDAAIPKEGGEGGGEDVSQSLPIPTLNATSKAMVRWWLAAARRVLRYRTTVVPLIEAAMADHCEVCGVYPPRSGGSGGGGGGGKNPPPLLVELMVPIDALADRFELEDKGGGGGDGEGGAAFDESAWRAFFLRLQRFRTVCRGCTKGKLADDPGALAAALRHTVTTRTDVNMGSVDAGANARMIARAWLERARLRLRVYEEKGGRVPLPPAVLSFGEKEGEGEESVGVGKSKAPKPPLPMDAHPVLLSSASIAIALRWLAEARKKILAR